VRHETRNDRRQRRAQIDGPVHVSEGPRPGGVRHEVRDGCTHRWAIQVGEESQDHRQGSDECQVLGKPEGCHEGRRAQKAHQENRPPPKSVGQLAPGKLRRERACPKKRHDQAGLAYRDAALRGQVQAEEWDHKTAQAVHDRPEPQEPEGRGQVGCKERQP